MPPTPEDPAAAPANPAGESELVRALRTQVVRDQVRILELDDGIADRDTEGAATRGLLAEAQAQLDLAWSEVRSLTKQRDDLAAEIPHIRHQQHLAGLELEKAHGLLREAIREKDDWVGRHNAAETHLAAERGAHEQTRAELAETKRAHEAVLQGLYARLTAAELESAGRATEIARHLERIEELDGSLSQLKVLRTGLETQRNRLRQESAVLHDELNRTKETLAQREAKLRAMQESFSWRVTMPLRWLRRLVLRK